jgi:uncharacterized membrane protein
MWTLLGVLVIVLGFALGLNTIATVVVAGITTGLIGGMDFDKVMSVLGKAFIDNRSMSIFIITLPLIGLLERYGLRERAAYLISQIKSATMGRITALYLWIRTIAAVFSVRLGGHAQFIRPLILPMSMGAAKVRYGEMKEEDMESVKGLNAAVENFGNFFGQNGFAAASGVLLIVATLKEQKVIVEAIDVATWSLIMAGAIMVIGTLYFLYWDRRLDQHYPTTDTKK